MEINEIIKTLERIIKTLEREGFKVTKKRAKNKPMREQDKKRTPMGKSPSEGMKRLAAIFRKTDRWTWTIWHKERYISITRGKTKEEFYDEIKYLEAFYLYQQIDRKKDGPCWWKRDFDTFLNNYDSQLDRAKDMIESRGWPQSIQRRAEQVIAYIPPSWNWQGYLLENYGHSERWEELPKYIQKEIVERKAG